MCLCEGLWLQVPLVYPPALEVHLPAVWTSGDAPAWLPLDVVVQAGCDRSVVSHVLCLCLCLLRVLGGLGVRF